MERELNIYEIMLELAEEENVELKADNEALWRYIKYLERENTHLIKEYNYLLNPDNRKN